MTKAEIERLIDDKPQEVKAKAILLYNGYTRAMAAYRDDASAVNLRNWRAAEEALTEYIASIGHAEQDTLDNIAAVLLYLQEAGWKITKTSLYRHQKEGKIIPASDGKYSKRVVDKYARTFLKQAATGKRVVEETDELQRRKLQKEIARLELSVEREKFNLERDRGLYVPREQMDIELAMRAGVLMAGLKHWIQRRASDWIAAVSGDEKRVGELIAMMNNDLEEHIHQYAANKEYEVVVESDAVQSDVMSADG